MTEQQHDQTAAEQPTETTEPTGPTEGPAPEQGAELVTWRNPYDVEVPETLRERIAYAKTLAAAGILPRDYAAKPHNVLVAGEMGRELGLSNVQAVLMLNVVEGRPTLGASGVRAVILRAGHRIKVTDREHSANGFPLSVTVTGWRHDDPGDPLTATDEDSRTYTLAMAHQQGLVQQIRTDEAGEVVSVIARSQRGNPLPWELSTGRMLEARATTWLGDTLFADVTMGLSVDREPEAPSIITMAEQIKDKAPHAPTPRAADVLQQVRPTRRTDLPDEYDPADDALLFTNGDEWYAHAGAEVSRRNKQQLAADRIARWVSEHPDQDVVPMPPAVDGETVEPAEAAQVALDADGAVDAVLRCAYPGCALDDEHEGDHLDEHGDVLVPEPHDATDPWGSPVAEDEQPADEAPADEPVVEEPPAAEPVPDAAPADAVPDDAPDLGAEPDLAQSAEQLLAEIDEVAAEVGKSRQGLMVRWIATHRKNPEDATADELLPFVEQLRTTMAARRQG